MELVLSNGICVIDDSDFIEVNKFNWYISNHGYVRRTNDKVYLHRFLTNAPKGKVVDHIDGNKLNNRRSNLRVVTQFENMANREKYKNGVWLSKFGWTTSVTHKGKLYSFPSYSTKEEAMIMYNRKAKEVFGEYAKLLDVIDDGREIKSLLEKKKTSKYKGVYLRSDKKKWVAQHKGKYLGSFNSEEEAHAAIILKENGI